MYVFGRLPTTRHTDPDEHVFTLRDPVKLAGCQVAMPAYHALAKHDNVDYLPVLRLAGMRLSGLVLSGAYVP